MNSLIKAMFNLFKKKNQKTQQHEVKREQGHPFKKPLPDLDELYSCSVQRTIKDFCIEQVNLNGATVNVAMDGLDGYDVKSLQSAFERNIMGQEIIFTHFATKGFIGFNNCAIIAQDWLVNKCLALPCEDAIAINYDITLKDAEVTEEDKDIISKIKSLSETGEKYNIKGICKEFAENKRKFGQALCIPLVEGVDYSIPFNIDALTPKSYKGMVVIEPIWVAPVLNIEATTNPMSKRYYKPTWFRMPDGTLIHYTWFIFNTYGDVSDILKPTYYFGGYPLPQLLYEQVYASEKTANEAPMLAQSKRLNYMEGNLNAYLTDEEKLHKEINLMSWLRNNWGWLFIKRDQKIGQLDTSLTDFDAVTMLGFQLVAAISGMPSARLLETSPKGWQSTGSYEDDNYSKLQQSIQRLDYCPILNLHYKLLTKSEFGIEKDYECVFDAIDTPTEKERAEIREINSRTDLNYINAGSISPDEVRNILREDINSGYNTLSEEMEGEGMNEMGEEPDPFDDLLGDSENPQAPFSVKDAWEESKHPRKKNGQFGEGGGSSEKVEKSSKRDKIDSSKHKTVKLPKEEYAQVMHELNTNLTKEQRQKKQITRAIGNNIYTIENNGFNEYRIIDKYELD